MGILLAIAVLQFAPAAGADGILFSNPRPVSASTLGDEQQSTLYLGGFSSAEAQKEYDAKVAAGVAPADLPGPEAVFSASLHAGRVNPPERAFNLAGYRLRDPASAPLASNRMTQRKALLFFTAVENKVFESCRAAGKAPEGCGEAVAASEIDSAWLSVDGGWSLNGTVVTAAEAGGARVSSVIERGQEIWLYYFSGAAAAPGIMRLRLDFGGTRLAPPEPVKFEDAPLASSFETAQVSRLRCDNVDAHAITMVAGLRDRTAVPFLASVDGVLFKQVAADVLGGGGKPITFPAQLPVRSSPGDCENFGASHETNRELVYSEQAAPDRWEIKLRSVKIKLP